MGSKPDDAGAPGGVERLRAIVSVRPWPCVAIGGVDADRVPLVRAISAICGRPDVAAASRAIRAAWDGASGRFEPQGSKPGF